MKWDYASVVVWGLDEKGLDGLDRFDKAVVDLAATLGADLEQGKPMNGYGVGVDLVRAGDTLLCCRTSGSGAARGSAQFECASTAGEVYPVLQGMFPQHSVSRLDAAEDYRGVGTWAKLEGMLTEVCGQHGVSMSPFGEGHVRPDGTRDETKGRTWYCGSKHSPYRIVLYEKGIEQLAKGIPADPTWVRLEVRIRPASKMKARIGSMGLKPSDIVGFSGWGAVVGEYMGISDLERVAIGSVWKPNETEQLALKIVRMFDNGIDKMLSDHSPEEFGRLIAQVHKKNREASALLDVSHAKQVEPV